MDQFVREFRVRESKLEDEISRKDEQIRKLNQKDQANRTNGFAMGEADKESAYDQLLAKRREEGMAENKRYLEKYVDMREFAYSSVESLMRKMNL